MAVRFIDGDFVKLPGRDVLLADLKLEIKAQVWRGMQRVDPNRAAGLKALPDNPAIARIRARIPMSPVITEQEYEQYLKAGQAGAESGGD